MQQVGLGHKPHQVPHILNAPAHTRLTLLQGDALGRVGSLLGRGGGGEVRRKGGRSSNTQSTHSKMLATG